MSNSKMTARERIEALLEANSFVELGGLVSARNTDYNLGAKKVDGDGVITGYGTLGDRMVYVYSQDVSMLGGSIGEMHAKKIASVYDMAMKTGAPVIAMMDCAGLRLQEANDALAAFGQIFFKQAQASGRIPQITAVFGMCGGGSSVMSAMSDFTFMTSDGALFVNSPNALEGNIETKLNTASAAYQAETAGNVDFVCETEEEMIQQMRALLNFLPSDHEADDAYVECTDDLNRVIADLNDAAYDAKFIAASISDGNVFVETKAAFAKEMMTGFIRLSGETVGVVANAETVMTADGLEKATRFVKFCDAFNIPVLTVTNVEGMKASVEEEKNLAKAMAKFTAELAGSTVAKVNLIAGKAFGTAGVVMNSKAVGADFVVAWPEASIGMMDAAQAVRIIYADEIAAGDQMTVINEKTAEYKELQSSAIAAAKRGYVDDIIEPDATRKRLIAAFEMLFGKKEEFVDRKHATI
ncbi:MAG: carboxyl transferase domain-containing protein [Eubacteriales bacterium]|nr:carboxyl transferase domain-containing protein [Eubacteriales bacterium]